MRIALGLEYDGSRFCGWQTQPGGCAVQDALERAITRVAGASVSLTCAGRTDAGVHATSQVAHFDAPSARPLSAWTRGVNSFLPDAVSVTWAREVSPAFHARFDATERCYRYVLLPRAERPGLLHGRVGWWHGPLDARAMRAATPALVGVHDFSAFRAAECQARSPVRDLRRVDIAERGRFITIDFAANAFLHHMVRNVVGALVYVGAGRRSPEWVGQLLAGRDRRLAPPTFAAAGLYLCGVAYPASAGLPAGPALEGAHLPCA